MDTKNYSLEKHLEAICTADDDYKLLLSAWRLNKENLPNALSTIASYFPNYSRHDDTHSMTLLDNIQRLLGRDRIERLGATDTFLILMSALTHDLGMYMSYTFLEEEWGKPEMEDSLKKYANHSDKQIAQAAKLLLDHRRDSEDPAKGFKWALEMRNAVTLIIAHQMRGGHEDRSKKYLDKKDDLFAKLAHDFYCDAFPSRYLSLLADVAHLHGTKFDEVMTLLNHKADGLKGDLAHPRFVACMIRLGDLLDVDSNRFNPFLLATLKEMPESSEAHYDKHNAVKHLLISPDGIEAELDCPTDVSFRIARELFDMLQQEVEKQSQNWNRIAPQDLGGLPPVLNQNKIIINFKGSKTKSELRNLRFDISGQRTFEMLKGGAIYENPGRVFIREIVQNALDATKLQVWKDMDYYLPYHLENPERDIKCVEDIKFTSDIPAWVYEKYPIHLNVRYDEEKQKVIVVCEDWGTGISEESLIRMTNQVGASRKADKDYGKTVEHIPYFLRPTAAFGLGLQTVFYVTDEFTVETHYPGEPTRRIVFRSSVDGSYCSIKDESFDFKRTVEGTNTEKSVAHGTTVTIEIGKEHFGELFEISEEQVKELDKDPAGCIYYIPEKINSYVKDCFSGIEFVPILYKSPFMLDRLGADEEIKDKKWIPLDEEHFRVYRYDGGYNDKFYIEENKFGSILNVDFTRSGFVFYSSNDLCLRGVSIDAGFSYLGNHSINIGWNLFSREADQLVTISRDSLLPKGTEWCTSTINSLMRDIIRLTYEQLHDECKECPSESANMRLLKQYFNLCLVNWNLPEPLEVDYQLLDDLTLDKEAYSDGEGNAIKASDLFKASVLVASLRYYKYEDEDILMDLKKISPELSKYIYVRDDEVIPDNYTCSAIYSGKNKEEERFVFCQLEKINRSEFKLVGGYVKRGGYHELIYGYSKYEKIVVGEDAPLLGYYKPYHGNCWIYPFGKLTIEDSLLRREKLYNKLKDGYIKKLVPDYIVKLIQKYNVLKNDKLTDEEIYKVYIQLILDFTNESEENTDGNEMEKE